jgi:membrane-bound lytic murein transglycosylase A
VSRRALVAAFCLVVVSGCAVFRGVAGPFFGWPWLPPVEDDLDLTSLRSAIAETAPVWERRGQEAERNAALGLLSILEETTDPRERLAAVEGIFRSRRVDREVLLTAYYEPELPASLAPDARFAYPLYARPTPSNGALPTRGEIDAGALAGRGLEIAWTDDPVSLLFLQIQGSGRLRLPDDRVVGAHFAGTNERPFTSIGRVLIDEGLLAPTAASADGIRRVLSALPAERRRALLARNERYVFFALGRGAVRGSLGVPLTPGRSIAADPRLLPPGSLAYLATPTYRRFVVVQDTGAAIQGARADLFLGAGRETEVIAGRTKERGRLYLLTPRS